MWQVVAEGRKEVRCDGDGYFPNKHVHVTTTSDASPSLPFSIAVNYQGAIGETVGLSRIENLICSDSRPPVYENLRLSSVTTTTPKLLRSVRPSGCRTP